MELSFRWYGLNDPVSLSHIRQIPRMQGIVSSLQNIAIGEAWNKEAVQAHAQFIAKHGMRWNVVESLPVHEEIKWGGPRRDYFIENYQKSMRAIAQAEIFIICYNFMPICDWMRTMLKEPFADGSHGLSYYHKDIATLTLSEVLAWNMPAWASFSKEEMQKLQQAFAQLDEATLRKNLEYFLQAVVPVAEEVGVRMAIHPDDPPWSIFGLPRIVKNTEDLEAIMRMVESPANGITFCTGSLGADRQNDLVQMICHFGGMGRIHFAHCRKVQTQGEKNFREVAHAADLDNAVDMAGVMRAYKKTGFSSPMRPDHGRTIWGEGNTIAGYGLYDRALGAMYLQGLWDAQ